MESSNHPLKLTGEKNNELVRPKSVQDSISLFGVSEGNGRVTIPLNGLRDPRLFSAQQQLF